MANPDHFRCFEKCINQPDRSPDAQLLPLVLSPILQIKESALAGDHLPPKTARNTRSYVHETPYGGLFASITPFVCRSDDATRPRHRSGKQDHLSALVPQASEFLAESPDVVSFPALQKENPIEFHS